MKLSELFQSYLDEMTEKGYFEKDEDCEDVIFVDGEDAIRYYRKPFYTWLLSLNDEGEKVGFVVFGQAPDCHPDCDYYIWQAYVLPEYRNQGRMNRMMAQFVNEHKGTYGADIVRNNKYAKAFWEKCFARNGYRRRGDILWVDNGAVNADQWFWSPKE